MNVRSFARTFIVVLILLTGPRAFADVHGVLRVVKGDVKIKSAQTGQVERARLGQEVFPKDTIITGKDARAKIVMIDNNEINVSPDSNIVIQNYEYNPAENKKDVLLNVIYGKVRSKVEQKYDGKTSRFQVKTPSAVAGVRGTDFVTSYDSNTKSSQVVTFRGSVQFGLPGPNGTITNSVAVTPGKMAQASAGGAPGAPTNVPKTQLAQMDNDTKADGHHDSRQPADDHNHDHHNDNQNSSGGNNNGASNNGSGQSQSQTASTSTSGSSSGDTSRTPASTSPTMAPGPSSPGAAPSGSMIQTSDLAGAGSSVNTNVVPTAPSVQQIVNAPPQPPTNPTTCLTCNQVIQNHGTSPLNITIK